MFSIELMLFGKNYCLIILSETEFYEKDSLQPRILVKVNTFVIDKSLLKYVSHWLFSYILKTCSLFPNTKKIILKSDIFISVLTISLKLENNFGNSNCFTHLLLFVNFCMITNTKNHWCLWIILFFLSKFIYSLYHMYSNY